MIISAKFGSDSGKGGPRSQGFGFTTLSVRLQMSQTIQVTVFRDIFDYACALLYVPIHNFRSKTVNNLIRREFKFGCARTILDEYFKDRRYRPELIHAIFKKHRLSPGLECYTGGG